MTEALLKQPLTFWKRPRQLLEPRIWHRENGIVVRDVTPDLDPFVVEHMTRYYLRNEPMSEATNVHQNTEAVAETQFLWRHKVLPQRVSIVALQGGTPGANLEKVSEENPPCIVGVNQLFVSTNKDEGLPGFGAYLKCDVLQTGLNAFIQCGSMVNVFERYGVDHYADGGGMSVATEWRGKGVGQMLVKGRVALCKALSIPVTKTVFSAIQSQKVALKGGFELLGEILYEDLRTPDGQLFFPKMKPEQKKIQVMAMRIP